MGLKELQQEYGAPMTVSQVAELLGVDRRTITKYPELYGGVWVAPGRLRFFENRIREILDANTIPNKSGCTVAGSGENRRESRSHKTVSERIGRETGRRQVGKRNKRAHADGTADSDPYGYTDCYGMGE